MRGRLAREFAKHAVEVCERLESHFVRDLAHAQIWIQEQVLRFLDSNTGKIIGEGETRRLLEELAEIKRARVHRPRHFLESRSCFAPPCG